MGAAARAPFSTSRGSPRSPNGISTRSKSRGASVAEKASRYDVRDVLVQAREAFPATEAPRDFDLVEIPFGERGEPRLVENGARPAARWTSIASRASSRALIAPAYRFASV